jgi:hypothetical protein
MINRTWCRYIRSQVDSKGSHRGCSVRRESMTKTTQLLKVYAVSGPSLLRIKKRSSITTLTKKKPSEQPKK